MTSFTSTSFSSASFTTGVQILPPIVGGGGGKGRRNRFRAWIAGLARDLRQLFRIKPTPPPPEDVEIPPAQSPAGQTVTILEGPPPYEKLETLNDKWIAPVSSSAVASSPPPTFSIENPESPEPDTYPLILNPLTSPIIQRRVALPRVTRQPTIAPYRVGEGSHIESQNIGMKLPRRINQSKAASIIQRLLILSEIERQL